MHPRRAVTLRVPVLGLALVTAGASGLLSSCRDSHDAAAKARVDAVQAGGYTSINVGSAPDGNAILIPKAASDEAMDYAQCIGCGACVASCKNASAALFTAAKVSHLALLPQGQPERLTRVRAMVDRMDAEGFGACSNEGECEATCPKGISIAGIARMNRQYTKAVLSGAGDKSAAASGD